MVTIIVECFPPPGFDSYRCGWREEVHDGRVVRIGLCWPAGITELPEGALTREQIEALQRDPGKRITVREVADPVEVEPDDLPVDREISPIAASPLCETFDVATSEARAVMRPVIAGAPQLIGGRSAHSVVSRARGPPSRKPSTAHG